MAVRLPLALAAVAAVLLLLLCRGGGAEARVLLTLDDFGGVGDGIANDTQALLDAWTAACTSSEEAVLAVPAGKAYRIWPVQLSGPCKKKLKLLISGAIVAPSSPDEWAGRDPMKWLYIYGVDGLSVSGGGTIDGMGQQWWASTCKRKKTQPCYSGPRPKAVHFEECRGVSVQGVTLQNAQQFQLTFTRCSCVKASFLRVIAPADSPNTDGIHLNDTSHVHITDNLISTGDDCVSMVGNCSDVHVKDISCGPGHGISIGSLGKNRTTDMVENVRVDTCLLTNTTNGVRIKSWQISGDIVAPESPSDWGQGQRSQWLHFHKVQDLKITGGGIIDGRGQQWWAQSSLMGAQPAPKAVHFEDCQGISVKGITLQNSQSYHLTFTRSSNVEANYLRVTSPEDSIDTKGIHLVDSFNVHVMDNLISTGDDCVSIVGNCEDVRLRAISCGPGHGISIGTLGVNNSVDYVEKIKVDTLFISNTKNGVRVRTTRSGGGGFARKVKFESIVMRNVTNPIIVDQGNSDHLPASSEAVAPAAATAVQVEKINYIDITGTSASKHAVTFSCSDAKPCRHLSLVNVNLTQVDGTKALSYCRKAFGRSIGTVIPESCLSKEDFVQHVPQRSQDGEEDSDS